MPALSLRLSEKLGQSSEENGVELAVLELVRSRFLRMEDSTVLPGFAAGVSRHAGDMKEKVKAR